jgi:hypothetical protein
MKFFTYIIVDFSGSGFTSSNDFGAGASKFNRWCFYHKLLDSSVGTSSFDYVIQQDFNRVLGKVYCLKSTEKIKFNTYPNPFIQTLNFNSQRFQMM